MAVLSSSPRNQRASYASPAQTEVLTNPSDTTALAEPSAELEQVQHPVAIAYHEPPNGGLVAWLQILGAFILFFNSWYAMFGFLAQEVKIEISYTKLSKGHCQYFWCLSDILYP